MSVARPPPNVVESDLMRACRVLFFALIFAVATAQPLRAGELTCAQILASKPGVGQLLGIVVGGRASGAHVPAVALELGYKIVHIYPHGLPAQVTKSFTDNYSFPAILYAGDQDLPRVEKEIRDLAETKGLRVAGFVAGMDYGSGAADWLAEAFHTPTNGREWMAMRNDKELMNNHLAARRVPVAASFSLTPDQALASASQLQYPLYGKARRSFASVGSAPVFSAESLPSALEQIQAEAGAMRINTEEIFFQTMLNRDRIYFADSAHAHFAGITKRITTGVWIDYRGFKIPGDDSNREDFPKHVWDYIEMLPPPHLLDPAELQLFYMMLEVDKRMAKAAAINAGSSHTEYMAPGESPRSIGELFPTDVNHRLPGLKASLLELRATGVNPFVVDIMARTQPEYLLPMPEIYSQWNEYVALIFLRSHYDGVTTEEGRRWLESHYIAPGQTPPTGRAYFCDVLVPPAGSPASRTVNGTTMVGTLHAAGPTRESIRQLLYELRRRERAGFFVQKR